MTRIASKLGTLRKVQCLDAIGMRTTRSLAYTTARCRKPILIALWCILILYSYARSLGSLWASKNHFSDRLLAKEAVRANQIHNGSEEEENCEIEAPTVQGPNANHLCEPQNYVVFSTTTDAFARKEDYGFLVPLTARSWMKHGFRPIILVVASNPDQVKNIHKVWTTGMLLPDTARVVAVVAPQKATITVAQIARLYVASFVPSLRPNDYVRVTDADMFIFQPGPFLPPGPNNGRDIDIFNGKCCLRSVQQVGNRTCRHYPMHSVGMTAQKWRSVFPVPSSIKGTSGIVSHILSIAVEKYGLSFESMLHGGKDWSIDQLLLGCNIDEAVEKYGYTLTLSPGSRRRIHVGDNVQATTISQTADDCHLAKFNLKVHGSWLRGLVDKTNVTNCSIAQYEEYVSAWWNYTLIKAT